METVYHAWITAEGKAFRGLAVPGGRQAKKRGLCKKRQVQGGRIPQREAYIRYAAATAGCSATQKLGFLQSHQTGIMTTGAVVHFSTRSATLPKLKCPSLPRLAITTMSIFCWLMILRISLAGSPTAMCRI